jgi:hypothetical protein
MKIVKNFFTDTADIIRRNSCPKKVLLLMQYLHSVTESLSSAYIFWKGEAVFWSCSRIAILLMPKYAFIVKKTL